MSYKRVSELDFPWSFEDLQKLPIFMKEEIFNVLDEFLKQETANRQAVQNGYNFQ